MLNFKVLMGGGHHVGGVCHGLRQAIRDNKAFDRDEGISESENPPKEDERILRMSLYFCQTKIV